MEKTTQETTAIGFQDVDMPSGAPWPEELAVQLAGCQVFVPLYSPRYFACENCGREWQIFSDRLAATAAAPRPRLVVPLLWAPEAVIKDHIPAVPGFTQYTDFGLAYGNAVTMTYVGFDLTALVRNKENAEIKLTVLRSAAGRRRRPADAAPYPGGDARG